MKKLIFTFVLLLISFMMTTEATDIVHKVDAQTELFKQDWYETNQSYYLEITLADGLKFPEKYKHALSEKGAMCAINCQPIEGHQFLNDSEMKLVSLNIEVILENTSNLNVINYYINSKSRFENASNIQTRSSKREGSISLKSKVATIDVKNNPEFITYSDVPNQGRIVFKKLANAEN